MSYSSTTSMRKKSARIERINGLESKREIARYLKKENWSPRVAKKSQWDLNDKIVRGQCLAYVILGGNPGYFILEEEAKGMIETVASLSENLWGGEEHPAKLAQDLLARVISAIDWLPTDEANLMSLVNFVNALPQGTEDYEIQYRWEQWKSVGLNFREKILTTEAMPIMRNYRFDVTTISHPEVLQKMKDSIPVMGIELEVTYSGRLDKLLPVLSMGVFKSDSTTDVEFVSVPLEVSELIEELDKRKIHFDYMLKENGVESNGMHVHVSRSLIPIAQQARICYLINASKNREFWMELADRDIFNNKYCQFFYLSRELATAVKSGDYSRLAEGHFPADNRNVTVNRCNRDTIEFRLFKSPDNLNKVIRNIRIVQAVLDYTAQGGYNLNGFREFLEAGNVLPT